MIPFILSKALENMIGVSRNGEIWTDFSPSALGDFTAKDSQGFQFFFNADGKFLRADLDNEHEKDIIWLRQTPNVRVIPFDWKLALENKHVGIDAKGKRWVDFELDDSYEGIDSLRAKVEGSYTNCKYYFHLDGRYKSNYRKDGETHENDLLWLQLVDDEAF